MTRVLFAGAFLGATLFAIGATAVLGVALGTRTALVGVSAINPAAPLTAQAGGAPAVVAMGETAPKAH